MKKKLTIIAGRANLDEAISFVEDTMRSEGFSEKQVMQTLLAVEEIFVNISYYAYTPSAGTVTLCTDTQPECISITFIDSGKPYNPLEKKDPDTTLAAEEKQVGGLGIFVTKKLMDDMHYRFENGRNILTIIKNKEEEM